LNFNYLFAVGSVETREARLAMSWWAYQQILRHAQTFDASATRQWATINERFTWSVQNANTTVILYFRFAGSRGDLQHFQPTLHWLAIFFEKICGTGLSVSALCFSPAARSGVLQKWASEGSIQGGQ